MLQAVSGILTLGLLVLSTVVGLRLLRIARAAGDDAVGLLGLYFLLHGTLATGLSVATYVSWSSAELALPDAAARALNAGFFVFSTIGLACLLLFTRRTFRPTSPAAGTVVAGLTMLMAVSVAVLAAVEGFEVRVLNGPAYWVHFAARLACWVWVAFESFSYWHQQRRRLAVGLADPVVTNRFLLWGAWGALITLLSFSDPVARLWYYSITETTTRWIPEVGRPIIDTTIPIACGLNAGALVLMVLTFFPLPAYRRWIAGRRAASPSA